MECYGSLKSISSRYKNKKRADVPHPHSHSLCGSSFLSFIILLSLRRVEFLDGNGETMGCELGDGDLDAGVLGVSSDMQAHRVS